MNAREFNRQHAIENGKNPDVFWGMQDYFLYAMENGRISSFTTGSLATVEEEIEAKGRDYDFWLVEKDGLISFYRKEKGKWIVVKTVRGRVVEDKEVEEKLFGAIRFMNYVIVKDEEKVSAPVKEEVKPESRLVEYGCSSREFESTEDVRNFVLDNRDEYDGYIVRSNNNWDSDTIYRWQELANGKIIWRKEKA